jgi:uncharacterized protein
MDALFYIVPLFFLTALLYSVAGFGGGSTYIAVLLLFSFPYESVPKISLACNLVVVAGGTYLFAKEGHLPWRKILPFVVGSIPAAYFGGKFPIGKTLFSVLLGISLLAAAIRMLLSEGSFVERQEVSEKKAWALGLPLGALLGGLAGLVGIGGGIFLSPLLYVLGWADAKEAAASAAFFILVNSVAGLAGQYAKSAVVPDLHFLLPLLLAVFAGGQVGGRLGSRTLPKFAIQRATALLVLWVSLRLLWKIVAAS